MNTLKNTYNGKEIIKLDRGSSKHYLRSKMWWYICGEYVMIFISATLRRNWEKNTINTGQTTRQVLNRPNNNGHAAQIHRYQRDFENYIEVLILKGNPPLKHKNGLWENKFICLLRKKVPTGLHVEFKHYKR